MCLFHHRYKVIGKYEYRDTSYGKGIPSTIYHLQCEKCGKIKDQIVTGWVKNV